MPGGFAPYGPPPGYPTGTLPGAVQVYGERRSMDAIRNQCEGNGGSYREMRPPPMFNMPGMVVDVPIHAVCDLPGGSAVYDRGSWNPPLTSLSGCSACGLGEVSEGYNKLWAVVIIGALAWWMLK
jgi:hypothetical protein